MTNPIQFPNPGRGVVPLPPMQPLQSATPGKEPAPADGKDFKSLLVDSLNEVNRLQDEADEGVQKLLTGESNNVAEVLAAADKAGIAFDLLMEIRNKLTDAYQEIQQMRV
ncbi:MAG: flagellar hook-basal body complex protein FliE [Planctomycetota bacterium]|jgi:flagellar hook-basal body complex protein FliE